MYILVDALSLELRVENVYGPKPVEVGEKIKKSLKVAYTPAHPENPDIFGCSVIEFTEPLQDLPGGSGHDTAVSSPGGFDRSPCGTGSSARVLPSQGQISVSEKFMHRTILGTEFITSGRGISMVANYLAVVPGSGIDSRLSNHRFGSREPFYIRISGRR
ncbi:hypothetical protein ACJZ2D_014006 [Fusarium nematophilum]